MEANLTSYRLIGDERGPSCLFFKKEKFNKEEKKKFNRGILQIIKKNNNKRPKDVKV